jgi:hypothetical protein
VPGVIGVSLVCVLLITSLYAVAVMAGADLPNPLAAIDSTPTKPPPSPTLNPTPTMTHTPTLNPSPTHTPTSTLTMAPTQTFIPTQELLGFMLGTWELYNDWDCNGRYKKDTLEFSAEDVTSSYWEFRSGYYYIGVWQDYFSRWSFDGMELMFQFVQWPSGNGIGYTGTLIGDRFEGTMSSSSQNGCWTLERPDE